MRTHVVQYTTTNAEAADDNQRLVEELFAQLDTRDPGGIRYATFRLADGVTFVHVVIQDTDGEPLDDLPAFDNFQRTLRERIRGNPSISDATLVGSYRFAR